MIIDFLVKSANVIESCQLVAGFKEQKKHPLRYSINSRYNFVSWVRQSSMTKVIATLLFYYTTLVVKSGFVYYSFDLILSVARSKTNLMSYIYFSLITSSTVGFEDMVVESDVGKVIVSLQIFSSILYSACMTAIFTVRLL